MNPIEIGKGQSFKGLAAYLLHGAKQEGEATPSRVGRVGWVQSYNLDGADGEQAWRLMVSTAKSADALKEAAGIKKGKPVKNTVYHYSLTFGPDEKPGEELQRKAVEESLAALGLEDHQALAVRHTDTEHDHVHVMVNLIDPATGMSAASPQAQANGRKASKLSNSRKKLSAFAARFERENGLKVNEGRLSNANRRAQGEKVDARRKSRNVYEREKREGKDRRRDFLKREHAEIARKIQDRSNFLKLQHEIDWDALKKTYRIEKEAIRRRMSPAMKERSAEVEERYKPMWAALLMRHEYERKAFEAADKTAIGRIWHGAATFRELALEGEYLGGFVAAFSREDRRNVVLRKHDRERAKLGQKQKIEIAAEMKQMKEDFDRKFAGARERFLRDCTLLKADHNAAWSEVRQAWKDYNAQRGAAFAEQRVAERYQGRQQDFGRGRSLEP